MKNIKLKFLSAFALMLLVMTVAEAQVKFNSIQAGMSLWQRSYAGADERALLRNYPGEGDFTIGKVMPTLGAEIGLSDHFAVDGRIGLWNGKFIGEDNLVSGLVIREEIEQTVIPLSLGLNYYYNDLVMDKLNAFAGVGVNRYFIQNKVNRYVSEGDGTVLPEKYSGNNYGIHFKLGVEYLLDAKLGIGLEGRYNTGAYSQSYTPEVGGAGIKQDISLRGMEIGLTLRYKFGTSNGAIKSDKGSEGTSDEQ
ncbi:porin family protein [Echinicola marina]|uniref:outer membrane beta-barrel protein n=1 Tax=Echinicola marina TaxID=2859768 RepID=UPI001CF6C986|nr:outer membrane beta-barrel protein [Echinicola marina]UCS93973.1 porin family protein [Echinicola marina]